MDWSALKVGRTNRPTLIPTKWGTIHFGRSKYIARRIIPLKRGNAGILSKSNGIGKTLPDLLYFMERTRIPPLNLWTGRPMVELINAIKELVMEIGKIGPFGIAALALLVALASVWILGGKP
jgi:hypothetical protein